MGVFAELHGAAAITTEKVTDELSKTSILKSETRNYRKWDMKFMVSLWQYFVEVITYGWRLLKYFFTNTVVSLFPVKIVFCRKIPNGRHFSDCWFFSRGCTAQLHFIQTNFIRNITRSVLYLIVPQRAGFGKLKWQVSPRNIISYKQQPLHIIF